MRRRSKKRQRAITEAPAVRSVSDQRTAVAGSVDEDLREFVRRLPCAVCLAPTLGSEPCHVRCKRRFGDWLEIEGRLVANLYPGCSAHHREQHARGVATFAAAHGIDLLEVGRAVAVAYLDGHEPETLGAAARAHGYVDGLDLRPGISEF
jgi:hypothetical protein